MRRDEADPLIAQLRAWGYAQQVRYCYSRADRSVHVLEQARDMAPGTRERALRDLVSRDGLDRRRIMATSAGCGLAAVPAWACDPVRATNDADRPHDNPEVAVDAGVPDELRWVDRALSSLSRQYPIRALCVRVEFCEPGTQRHKAVIAAKRYGGQLTLWQYRRELTLGIEAMRGYRSSADER